MKPVLIDFSFWFTGAHLKSFSNLTPKYAENEFWWVGGTHYETPNHNGGFPLSFSSIKLEKADFKLSMWFVTGLRESNFSSCLYAHSSISSKFAIIIYSEFSSFNAFILHSPSSSISSPYSSLSLSFHLCIYSSVSFIILPPSCLIESSSHFHFWPMAN